MASFSQRPVYELTPSILNFSILTVYSLVQGYLKWQLCLFSSILGTTSQVLMALNVFTFSQCHIMFNFQHFLYPGQSDTRSKMWNLVVTFSFWHTNLGFSLSLQISCFLNSLCFFSTPWVVLLKVRSESNGGIQLTFSPFLCFHKPSTSASLVCSMLVSKIYYLDFFLLLYLWRSGTSASLVYSTLVSKVSYHDFYLPLYLHRPGTRLLPGIALFRLHFITLLYFHKSGTQASLKTLHYLWLHFAFVTRNWLKSQNGTLFSHVWRWGRLALDPL